MMMMLKMVVAGDDTATGTTGVQAIASTKSVDSTQVWISSRSDLGFGSAGSSVGSKFWFSSSCRFNRSAGQQLGSKARFGSAVVRVKLRVPSTVLVDSVKPSQLGQHSTRST
ncbi:hypothetical protein Hanom_Chr10g00905151 [Helianthus anomalus]